MKVPMNFLFNTAIKLGGATVSDESPTFIIAEGGVNHNGEIELGKRLVAAAAITGADAVKFQMFHPEDLLLPTVSKARYQESTSGGGNQYEMLEKLALSIEQMAVLKETAESEGLAFICTPFDSRSLAELSDLGVAAVKVASTDTTNTPFLGECAKVNVPVILSTAMSYMAEVERAVQVFAQNDKRDLAVLQCTGNYPAPFQEANIRVVEEFRSRFGCVTGYSDHTVGYEAAMLSVAAGGRIVEKHLTLDKSLPGPDHQASADVDEFAALVEAVRRSELMLGSREKLLSASEIPNRGSLQKSIVLASDVPADATLTLQDVRFLRTGGLGISPIYWNEVSRMHLTGPRESGHLLKWEDVKW